MSESLRTQNDSIPIHNRPLVYDVGMNNGDDSEYYLFLGYRVVAIDANPHLCKLVSERFRTYFTTGQIKIVNVGVGDSRGRAPFYIHKNSVLSTFVPHGEREGYTATIPPEDFKICYVDIKRLSDIVNFFGEAEYIKIDVEGFDAKCLRDLDLRRIYPAYLSAEAHSIETICHMIAMGYNQFKMVSGERVEAEFSDHPVRRITDKKLIPFSFKHHSAGPFGEDIPGAWVDRDTILNMWLNRGSGWFDIHAKRT